MQLAEKLLDCWQRESAALKSGREAWKRFCEDLEEEIKRNREELKQIEEERDQIEQETEKLRQMNDEQEKRNKCAREEAEVLVLQGF